MTRRYDRLTDIQHCSDFHYAKLFQIAKYENLAVVRLKIEQRRLHPCFHFGPHCPLSGHNAAVGNDVREFGHGIVADDWCPTTFSEDRSSFSTDVPTVGINDSVPGYLPQPDVERD